MKHDRVVPKARRTKRQSLIAPAANCKSSYTFRIAQYPLSVFTRRRPHRRPTVHGCMRNDDRIAFGLRAVGVAKALLPCRLFAVMQTSVVRLKTHSAARRNMFAWRRCLRAGLLKSPSTHLCAGSGKWFTLIRAPRWENWRYLVCVTQFPASNGIRTNRPLDRRPPA
jgi:hypothetical protein